MALKRNVLNIGAGVQVRVSVRNPRRDSARLTAFVAPGEGPHITAANAPAFARAAFPQAYDDMLLRDTDARVLKGGGCLLVGNYSRSIDSAGSGFVRTMERSPAGYRMMVAYNITPEYLANVDNYANGKLKPILVPVPQTTVRWSSTFYSDIRPTDRSYMSGWINSNRYTIDGYAHEPRTLRYEAQWITHEKYGGIDRWTVQNVATFDPMRFEDEQVQPDPNDDTKYVRLDPIRNYLEAAVNRWPDLP